MGFGLLKTIPQKTIYAWSAGVAAVLLAVFVFLVPQAALANFGSWLGESIILPIANFLGGLTVTLIGLLISIAQYNDFINSPAVAKGWVIVRDVVNMFVIVVMLLIAFATVFRIEEYQYKKLLSKLLIMSVLVNFSKMLTGFFIDFSQVIMLTFVNGFKEAAAANFVNGFHLQDMFSFAQSQQLAGVVTDDNSFFVASILALISITVALVVVAVYLVIFLLRIAFLWILTIISPLAYLLSAFPGEAKKYSSEWWEYFGKYLSSGPILAFFLWLALALMQSSTGALGNFTTTNDSSGLNLLSDVPGASVTKIGQSDILLSFIINIVILLGGLWMAQRLGVAGGKLAGSALNKLQSVGSSIAKSPFKAAGWGVKRVWGSTKMGWNNWTSSLLEAHEGHKVGWGKRALFAALNPVAAARGWEARTEELEHEAKEVASAYGREVTERFRTRGKLQIPYATFVERKAEDEYMKDYQNMTKEEFMHATRAAEDMSGVEGQRRRRAIVKSAASQGYLDDILRYGYFANKYGKDNGVLYDDETLNNFLYGYLGHDKESMRLMTTDLDKLGKATNHAEYLGHAYFDPKKGVYRRGYEKTGKKDSKGNDILRNTWQKDYARSEWQKLPPRVQVQDAPHSELGIVGETYTDDKGRVQFKVDSEGQVLGAKWGYGKGAGPTPLQKGIMSATSTNLADIRFSQPRMKEAFLSAEIDRATGEIVVHALDDLTKIKTLFDEVPSKILAYYKQKAYLPDSAVVKGFGVRIETADGKVQRERVGDIVHKSFISQSTATDIVSDKVIEEKDPKTKSTENAISDIIDKLVLGELSSLGDIANEIKKMSNNFNPGINPNEAANKIFEYFSRQRHEFYEPTAIMSTLDQKNIIGREMNVAVKAIKEALRSGFKAAFLDNGKAVNSPETFEIMRQELRKVFKYIGGDKPKIIIEGGVDENGRQIKGAEINFSSEAEAKKYYSLLESLEDTAIRGYLPHGEGG